MYSSPSAARSSSRDADRRASDEHDLLRGAAEKMVAGAAFGKHIAKSVRRGDPDGAENVRAAAQKRVRQQTDRRADHGHPGRRLRQPKQLFERVVDQCRPGDQQHIAVGYDRWRLIGGPEERKLLGFEGRRVLLEHQETVTASFELAQERHKRADDDDLVTGAYLGRIERIDAGAQLGLGMWTAMPAGIRESVHG